MEHWMYLGRVDYWTATFDGRIEHRTTVNDFAIDRSSKGRGYSIYQEQNRIRVYSSVQDYQEAIQALF